MSNYYYGQSSSSTSNQSESSDSNVETKLITVQAKSSSHPYFSQGSSKGYFIDGKESPSLILRQNVVYRFDQSDSSNTNHQILFFTDANRINSYQKNISEVGIAGSTGAYTEITLSSETPIEIFYQCQNHSLMGSNIKSSTSGNDSLTSSSNNELFDGGEGSDTVIFNGKFSNYSFTRTSTSLELDDQRTSTNDGTDTLSNIEFIQFTDQTIEELKVDIVKTYSGKFSDYKFYNKGNGIYQIKTDSGYDDITGLPLLTFSGEATTSSFRDISTIVDIKGTFDQVTGLTDPSGEMFQLYNAAFKRFPDPNGLKYWIDVYSSGINTNKVVAASFVLSDEFKRRYGENVSNGQYITNLYKNVFNREPDQGGYSYWVGSLDREEQSRSDVLLNFSISNENNILFTEMTGLS